MPQTYPFPISFNDSSSLPVPQAYKMWESPRTSSSPTSYIQSVHKHSCLCFKTFNSRNFHLLDHTTVISRLDYNFPFRPPLVWSQQSVRSPKTQVQNSVTVLLRALGRLHSQSELWGWLPGPSVVQYLLSPQWGLRKPVSYCSLRSSLGFSLPSLLALCGVWLCELLSQELPLGSAWTSFTQVFGWLSPSCASGFCSVLIFSVGPSLGTCWK